MTIIIILALPVIGWRIYHRQFTRAEWIMLAVAVGFWAMVVVQSMVASQCMPEKRYWIQCGVLFVGWAVIALDKISALVVKRMSRNLLPSIAVGCFAALALVMLIKAYIPGSRRNSYLLAMDWAANIIRADYCGPTEDKEYFYSDKEYHLMRRPAVLAHCHRLPYILNGRHPSPRKFGKVDIPDYIVDEEARLKFPEVGTYEKMAEKKFGKRTFLLYRRKIHE